MFFKLNCNPNLFLFSLIFSRFLAHLSQTGKACWHIYFFFNDTCTLKHIMIMEPLLLIIKIKLYFNNELLTKPFINKNNLYSPAFFRSLGSLASLACRLRSIMPSPTPLPLILIVLIQSQKSRLPHFESFQYALFSHETS